MGELAAAAKGLPEKKPLKRPLDDALEDSPERPFATLKELQ